MLKHFFRVTGAALPSTAGPVPACRETEPEYFETSLVGSQLLPPYKAMAES
ncbi:MAG: hypothetical protein BroJett011_01310 [Chloroflexota bacterium]|nr:MAG: hypothetical protein BroJett011_01310 [Chloroflexota bacterium]